ncbi:hypothetical protein KDA_31370 [Dictyobacter alpinus]|uniref:Peptide deformylase n=1 Tax=Dictyobacter alpinus TaxID=2014873 RepID=A0A402B8B7_9CHLR|nr:peptide deformylase [Dictyobacter alpinus]GCE27653.1 hypothetical protein KDA_31370 [Dictyobacter alpinus]
MHRFDASLPQLVQDMFETMQANDGVGLAAPQIGLSLRLFVVEGMERETNTPFKLAMANPEIVNGVNVRRAARVVVKGQDIHGKPLRVSAHGYYAWALQHEIDHLNGVLYLDHLDHPEDLREIHEDNAVEEKVSVEKKK